MKKTAGRPMVYETESSFEDALIAYLEFCEEKGKFPNISGAARFLKMARCTFYTYKDKYPEIYEYFDTCLEDEVLQQKDVTTKIFYLKNKFGYLDRVQTENTNHNTNNNNKNYDMSKMSTEQIKELLGEE